ncbi:hypothetical protein T492DRAFT_897301, partial [Pavlovales sp. CCMP2436]
MPPGAHASAAVAAAAAADRRSIKGPMIRVPDDLMREDYLIKALYPIKLQIDLAVNSTLVSGHLLDTQIKLPMDLANNSQKYIQRSPTEASTLSPCCPPAINALMPLNSLEANKLPPCLTEINALMPLNSLEANELPTCPTEGITLTPCCPLEVNMLPLLLLLEINSLPLHQLEINSLPLLLRPDNCSLCFRPPPSCPFEGVCGSLLDSPSPPQLFYGLAALSPTQLFYGLDALSPTQLFYGLAALSPQLIKELTAAHAPQLSEL